MKSPLLETKAVALSPEEVERLANIVQEIPGEVRQRYEALVAKRCAETLTEEEHPELIKLSDAIEAVEVKRLEYLAELAKRRGIRLTTLMELLDLKSPSYA